jgi:hypothetical protein
MQLGAAAKRRDHDIICRVLGKQPGNFRNSWGIASPLRPGILAGLTMTDPDPESIWLLFGPLNAVIYGAVGYTLCLLLVGDNDNSAVSKKEGRDRPLGL